MGFPISYWIPTHNEVCWHVDVFARAEAKIVAFRIFAPNVSEFTSMPWE